MTILAILQDNGLRFLDEETHKYLPPADVLNKLAAHTLTVQKHSTQRLLTSGPSEDGTEILVGLDEFVKYTLVTIGDE